LFSIARSQINKSRKTKFDKPVALLFVAFQLLVYFPALKNPSPWSDDWAYLYFSNDSKRNIAHDALASGRPVLGFLDQLAFQTDFIVNNLVILQVISIFGILFLQSAIFSKLKKNVFPYLVAILIPLTLILMPGFQGYVYFLSCFPYAWACFFGFLSYDYINGGHLKRVITGYVLLVFSFLIYPAGAMFYFLSYSIDYLVRFREGSTFRNNISQLVSVVAKLAFCAVVGMLIASVVRTYFKVTQASRIELLNGIDSIMEKFLWVLTRLFVSEFRIFTVASPSPTRAVIELVLVLSLFVIFFLLPVKDFNVNKLLNFGLLIFIPLLGALPNLLILENQFEFRTLTSTYAISLTLWVSSIYGLLHRVFQYKAIYRKFNRNVSSGGIVIACIPLVLFAAFHVQTDSKALWVKPSLIRDQITSTALQELGKDNNQSICMVLPGEVYLPIDKLGTYSMQSDLVSAWVPEPYMRLQLESFSLNVERSIKVRGKKGACSPSDIHIDYSELGEGRKP
jgi:hypothetical protein